MTDDIKIVQENEETLTESSENQIMDENEGHPGREENEISKLKMELEESKDKYLRLFAEFDNFKKRTMKERLDLLKNAAQDTLQVLLPIIDDFDRAKKASEAIHATEKFPEGVNLVYHKFVQTLEARGLKAMVSDGEAFDAEKHEAITEVPAPNPSMAGKIVDTIEKGYYLHDKIIRYAKVVVGK